MPFRGSRRPAMRDKARSLEYSLCSCGQVLSLLLLHWNGKPNTAPQFNLINSILELVRARRAPKKIQTKSCARAATEVLQMGKTMFCFPEIRIITKYAPQGVARACNLQPQASLSGRCDAGEKTSDSISMIRVQLWGLPLCCVLRFSLRRWETAATDP